MDYFASGTMTMRILTGDVLTAKNWQHVALVYDSSGGPSGTEDYLMYRDGILVKTVANNTTFGATTGDLHIGTNTASPGPGGEDPFKGHMDEIRISSGVARYSRSIERFANTFVAKGDTGDAFTAFQVQSNGAKNGTGFSLLQNEISGRGHTIHTIGHYPVWRNSVGDGFGGANTALYWGGTGNIRLTYNSALHELYQNSTNGYCVEAWINVEDANGYHPIFSTGTNAYTTFWAFLVVNYKVRFQYHRSGTSDLGGYSSTAQIKDNTWTCLLYTSPSPRDRG